MPKKGKTYEGGELKEKEAVTPLRGCAQKKKGETSKKAPG